MDPIWTDPERMSGTPCFTGTRVPVADLFDFLMRDSTVSEFLDAFPTVKREQVTAVLEMSRTAVIPPSQRPVRLPMAAGAA